MLHLLILWVHAAMVLYECSLAHDSHSGLNSSFNTVFRVMSMAVNDCMQGKLLFGALPAAEEVRGQGGIPDEG